MTCEADYKEAAVAAAIEQLAAAGISYFEAVGTVGEGIEELFAAARPGPFTDH